MFGSRLGFFRVYKSNGAIPVSIKSKMAAMTWWQQRKYPQEPSDVSFHFGDRHLGYLAISTLRDTGSDTIKKFDPANMGIAVGILLLCALEVEICLGKIPTSGGQTSQKTVAGTWVLQYAYFQTACSQNNAYVESTYFGQKCINFHLQPLRFEKFSWERNPGPLLTGMERGNVPANVRNVLFVSIRTCVQNAFGIFPNVKRTCKHLNA